MKTVFVLSLIATSILAAGCATTPPTRANLDGSYVCNADRMAQINREARLEGKQVIWLHCPLAKLKVVG